MKKKRRKKKKHLSRDDGTIRHLSFNVLWYMEWKRAEIFQDERTVTLKKQLRGMHFADASLHKKKVRSPSR